MTGPAERCAVLGGGLIGSHVAVALAAGGHRVAVLSSHSAWLVERAQRSQIELIEATLEPGSARLQRLLDPEGRLALIRRAPVDADYLQRFVEPLIAERS